MGGIAHCTCFRSKIEKADMPQKMDQMNHKELSNKICKKKKKKEREREKTPSTNIFLWASIVTASKRIHKF
jgi:hypothetical protein